MDLYEHQGKQLFAEAGIPVPRSWTVHPGGPDPVEIAGDIGLPVVVKAQVLSGGRGKAGGIKVVRSAPELTAAVAAIMGMTIGGRRVAALLLEETVDIARELYLAVTVDRGARRPLLMVSARGGVDIEAVAREEPQAILRLDIDPLQGLAEAQIRELTVWAGLADDGAQELAQVVWATWRLFCAQDATLVEINPLVRTGRGRYMALDAKVSIDDNALYRHRRLREWRQENDEQERRAGEAGFRYVTLDGDIGVLGNGAGLVMSTLDLIAAAGGRAANFLDVGGGARAARIAAALEIVLSDADVKVLLVTIFGGITRCDEMASGLLEALRATGAALPVVVRLEGTNAAPGRAVIDSAGLPRVVAATSAWDAVQRAVLLAREATPGGSAAAGAGA